MNRELLDAVGAYTLEWTTPYSIVPAAWYG